MFKNLPLTLKISLVVALAVALSTALIAASVTLMAHRAFDQYIHTVTIQRTNALRLRLERHYAQQGSWQGIEPILSGEIAPQFGRPYGMGMREGMAPGTTSLLLVDPTGHVLYDPTMTYTGRTLSGATLRSGVPLKIQGQTVGYLVPRTGAQEIAFLRRLLITTISSGALAALLAIGVGLVLTQSALRPLKELEAAAERLGAGDLGVRVRITSHDEIGDLAERFNRMAADLQQQDQLRRRLMNDIAHELRTPLTVMQGTLEALEDGVFPMDTEHLKPVLEQTLLLKRLVNDVRDLALAEAGQMTLDRAPMDVAALIQRMAARYKPSAQARGITLETTASPSLPLIKADTQRMEQVLENLISNALRYTSQGGKITLSAEQRGPWLRINIQDTGEGILPADLPHIFERFYRGDPARHRGEEGHTGLGLAIARELIRAHGGEITVESLVGEGTVFHIDLPINDPEASKAEKRPR